MNNSVIVVEHDEQIMREADWIVDIGPKAGRLGGKVLFSGTPEELLKTDTLTAQYLNGTKSVTADRTDESRQKAKNDDKWLTLSGCTGNNLKNVTARIPLGKMVCITGVSGSGKSSLINQTLYPILSQHFYRSKQQPLPYEAIAGMEYIDKVINVDHLLSVALLDQIRQHTRMFLMTSGNSLHNCRKQRFEVGKPGVSPSTPKADDVKSAWETVTKQSKCTLCPTYSFHAKPAADSAITARRSK